jgi:hypothetical protein
MALQPRDFWHFEYSNLRDCLKTRRLPKDQKIALEKLKVARLGNKDIFDKTH